MRRASGLQAKTANAESATIKPGRAGVVGTQDLMEGTGATVSSGRSDLGQMPGPMAGAIVHSRTRDLNCCKF